MFQDFVYQRQVDWSNIEISDNKLWDQSKYHENWLTT